MGSIRLGNRDRVALVALGGIALAVVVWTSYAYIDSVFLHGDPFWSSLFVPDGHERWNRMVAVMGIFAGTLGVLIAYSRQLEAGRRLRLEQARTREVYDNSPDPIAALDADFVVRFANRRALTAGEVDESELSSVPCYRLMHGLEAPCPDCTFEEVRRTRAVCEATVAHEEADGSRRWVSRFMYPICSENGEVESVVEVVRDVTELRDAQDALVESHHRLEQRVDKRTEELLEANRKLRKEVLERERVSLALAESERRYRAIVDDAPDMVLVHDSTYVAFVNSAGAEMLGLQAPEEAMGIPVRTLWEPNGSGLTPEELEEVISEGTAGRPVSVKLRRADGTTTDVEVSSTPLVIDGKRHVQCLARDITERVRAQDTIRRMAFYDALTGLPNRTLFRDRLAGSITRSRRSQTPIAVAFLDLDDFKVVNDTLGHSIGDGLLKGVAERLTGLLRETDTVAHHSGDEFTIIAEIRDASDADRLAERILSGLRPAFMVDGHELHVTASLGMAICPDHSSDSVELLKQADTAMYQSKEWGHNQYRIFSPDMGSAAEARLRLETDLRHALERREFVVFYQPQVDSRTDEVVGVEALLRWNHPERGLVSPDEFLPVAEQAGLITHIGRFVLTEACTRARMWHEAGLEFGKIAVNLSAREFMQPGLIPNISATLESTGLSASMLELEITETVAMHGTEHVLLTLRRLRDLGVRIAIDDFGTGYSSMSYLQRFPIQTLKIAQTFMRDVCCDLESAAIAGALIELCKVLDLDIVAEGVETLDQVAFLAERGAHVVQGYVFCRPVPHDELCRRLEQGIGAVRLEPPRAARS